MYDISNAINTAKEEIPASTAPPSTETRHAPPKLTSKAKAEPKVREKFDSEFSCKRQKFENNCSSKKEIQIVLRWYVKNGVCHSYPYIFCQGTTVKEDRTMRTKEECEAYCTGKTASQEAGVELEELDGKGNFISEKSKTSLKNDNSQNLEPGLLEYPLPPESHNPMNPLDENNFTPPTQNPIFPTLSNPIQGDVEKNAQNYAGEEAKGVEENAQSNSVDKVEGDARVDVQLEEIFPPGYSPEIDEDNKTRVVLHSDVSEPIPIAPPDERSHEESKLLSEGLQKAIKQDIKSSDAEKAENKDSEVKVEESKSDKKEVSSDPQKGMKILKRPPNDGKRSHSPQKPYRKFPLFYLA